MNDEKRKQKELGFLQEDYERYEKRKQKELGFLQEDYERYEKRRQNEDFER